jgi:purine-binding chemotaxis protein CheW
MVKPVLNGPVLIIGQAFAGGLPCLRDQQIDTMAITTPQVPPASLLSGDPTFAGASAFTGASLTPGDSQYLVFALSGLRCALPREAVRELLPLPHLSRPPGLPAALAGFANLGGEPLPVLVLSRLLGVGAAAGVDSLYRHIIVVSGTLPGSRAGLLVDRVLNLTRSPAGSLRPVPPEETLNGCVTGAIAMADGFVHVLDPSRILLAQEQDSLAELTRLARARLDEWAG